MQSTTYPLAVAAAARDILANAHAEVLLSLGGKLVFVTRYASRSELQVLLTCPAPTIFRAGRFTFTANDVKEIRPAANDNWLIVLH